MKNVETVVKIKYIDFLKLDIKICNVILIVVKKFLNRERKSKFMKINKKLFSEEKAITLIALVITIIVLLILAGISLATLSGNNSIIEQSKNAKERTIDAQNDEDVTLKEYQDELANQIQENFGDGNTSGETYKLVGSGDEFGRGSNMFWIKNSLGEYVSIEPEFNPKMTIEGESGEIYLSSYITNNSYLNGKLLNRIELPPEYFGQYGGKTATITLNMNGTDLTWTGKIGGWQS